MLDFAQTVEMQQEHTLLAGIPASSTYFRENSAFTASKQYAHVLGLQNLAIPFWAHRPKSFSQIGKNVSKHVTIIFFPTTKSRVEPGC